MSVSEFRSGTVPTRRLAMLCAIACASFAATLWLPYIGEEATWPVISMEMRVSREWFVTTLYGTSYGRPPVYNWLILAVAEVLGWDRVLVASRLVSAVATILSALVTAAFAARLSGDRRFAALAALVYLTSDALMYRGWLAYSDPVFSLFVFSAIACLWIAAHERRALLLAAGALLVTCAALSKVQTAYVYYGLAGLALLFVPGPRRYLLSPASIAIHAALAGFYLFWYGYVTRGAQHGTTIDYVLHKLREAGPGAWLAQVATFPLETALRFAPASFVAGWCLWRARAGGTAPAGAAPLPVGPLAAIAALNFLPYWLGPMTGIRYLMPVYPLFAILIAWAIWRAGEARIGLAVRWMTALIVLKYVAALVVFPWHQQKYRGDWAATAATVVRIAEGHPLYVTDDSGSGLSVAAHIDQLRMPRGPLLTWPPAQWDSGFVLSYTNDPKLGRLHRRFELGGNETFLLCRGAACERPAQ